jgi:hypothetical protein
MGAPFNQLEMASFMTCSKGYMGECGIRGGIFICTILNCGSSIYLCDPLFFIVKKVGSGTIVSVQDPSRPGSFGSASKT